MDGMGACVCAPNRDAFLAYRASLIGFIGHGTGDSLDVGVWRGAGVARFDGMRLLGNGDRSVEELISAAEQAGSADYYRIAAADLPFGNCSFDLAVAYNVLMDGDVRER